MGKKKTNQAFPEGAISAQLINKINEVHITRALEEGGAEELINILAPFSEGKILEHIGHMKKARETFKNILKKNPRNKWAMAALNEIEMNLH